MNFKHLTILLLWLALALYWPLPCWAQKHRKGEKGKGGTPAWLPEVVFVEGGNFTMGCTPEQGGDCRPDEKPAHPVTVGSFYMATTEVTQQQWELVMGYNPSRQKIVFPHLDYSDFAVDCIAWGEAVEYCRRLSGLTGQQWRLPTEAEWEYAARGGNRGSGSKYALGHDPAWPGIQYEGYHHPVDARHEVKLRPPNELGLYGMSGNVWEWCSDWYGPGYYARSPLENPTGPTSGSRRVLRGGPCLEDCYNSIKSWIKDTRLSMRENALPDFDSFYFGLRPVRVDPMPQTAPDR